MEVKNNTSFGFSPQGYWAVCKEEWKGRISLMRISYLKIGILKLGSDYAGTWCCIYRIVPIMPDYLYRIQHPSHQQILDNCALLGVHKSHSSVSREFTPEQSPHLVLNRLIMQNKTRICLFIQNQTSSSTEEQPMKLEYDLIQVRANLTWICCLDAEIISFRRKTGVWVCCLRLKLFFRYCIWILS